MSLGLGIDLAIIGAGGFAVPFEFVNSLYSDGDRSFAQLSSAVNKPEPFGNALEFDGVNDYVSLTTGIATSGDVTLTCWFKYTGGDMGNIYGNSGSGSLSIRVISSTQVRWYDGSNNDWTVSSMSVGEWYHLFITKDGTVGRCYLNGVEATNTTTLNGTMPTINQIGRYHNGTIVPLDGQLDDVAIKSGYVGTLSNAQDIYNEGAGQRPNNVISALDVYYKFNESSGTSAADSSGNSNTGTLNNFTGTYFVPHDNIYTAGFVLSCWIYFDGSISNEYIFGQVGDANMFFRFDSSTSATFQTSIGTSTTWTISANSTGWNHVAMSLNGGVNELWINSVKSTGTTEDYDEEAINISLIGRSDTSYGLFVMDELIIDARNATLTQTQVNSLYKSGKGVLSNTVITTPDIFYRFDQTSGTTVPDSSGNGNNATIYFPTNGDWSPHELEAPTITGGSVNTTSPAQVVLTGTNFYSVTSLSASGTAVVESYTIDSVTQITATVNVETAGDYSITVNNIVGSDTIASQTIALYDFGNYIQPDLGNTTEGGTLATSWDSTDRFSNIVVAYWAKRPIGADTSKTNIIASSTTNPDSYIYHRNTSPYIRFASDGDGNHRRVEWSALNITDNDWHHFYYFYNNHSLTEDITQQPTGAADGTYTSISSSAYPPGGTGLDLRAFVSGGSGDIARLSVMAVGSGYRVGDEITFTVDGQEAKAVLSKVPDTVDFELNLVYDGVLQTRSSSEYQFDGVNNFGSIFYRGSNNTLHSEIAVDDLVFDQHVSTVAEAQAIYNNERGGNVTNIFGSQPLYWYKFNEANGATTIAQSGSVGSADMTLTNFTGAYLLPKSGYNFENALSYDGTDDYCDLGGNITVANSSTEFTMSVWLKPEAGLSSGQLWIFENSNGKDLWFFYPTVTYFRLNGSGSQNAWTYGYDSAGHIGSWHHYVVTRDSSNVIEMYVDGVQQTKSTSNTNSANFQIQYIGTRASLSATKYKGLMDEFIIKSGYAATPADVVSLYNDGLGIDSSLALPSPLAYWKFNETTGTTASDSSGNGNDLTLNNFTGTPWVPH